MYKQKYDTHNLKILSKGFSIEVNGGLVVRLPTEFFFVSRATKSELLQHSINQN